MFIPTTPEEMAALGWDQADVILVTGDSYIDHPAIGIAVIGQVLLAAGYRVGIIAQPDLHSDRDIARLGEPRLFWGVSAGSIDSLVANYTAAGRRRKRDDYTPGGVNDRRPDRALIVYTNLIRRFFKETRPIVLGGIEASTRRIAHHDFWSGKIRRSVLFDAKADILVYGMGEKAVLELARRLAAGADYREVRGICCAARETPADGVELPSFESAAADRQVFLEMFRRFRRYSDDPESPRIFQRQDTRYLVQNPPQPSLTPQELDDLYALPFEREPHPYYARQGEVRALATIRFAITTHRGCFGGCHFCSIGIHQGRGVVSRSPEAVLEEARSMVRHPAFKGIIADVGGPTANMYAFFCGRKPKPFACRDRQCLFPAICPHLRFGHQAQIDLLRRLRQVPGVKKAFVASGVRHDLVMADARHGEGYLRELVCHHVSGQMKIAPEHSRHHVQRLMGKPGTDCLMAFKDRFYALNRESRRKQFLTYYFIAAHPGCTLADMEQLKRFATRELRTNPEQVQLFTPLPSTWSGVMYWTGIDPATGEAVFVEEDPARRQRQKDVLVAKTRIRKR